MTAGRPPTRDGPASLSLITQRTVRATPEALFRAWTTPEILQTWWGPAGVECCGVEIDLRVGGAYRIGNRTPDGSVVWIAGVFEAVTPPHGLVFTWSVGGDAGAAVERVAVTFTACEAGTRVVVRHDRIPDAQTRDSHEAGWTGCLDGLARVLDAAR